VEVPVPAAVAVPPLDCVAVSVEPPEVVAVDADVAVEPEVAVLALVCVELCVEELDVPVV
jgi:hypothetical protein